MVEAKRNLAYTFVRLKHEVLRDITVVDLNLNTDLDACVELIGTEWKTINTVKYLKNEDMVLCLLLLMSIVRTLSIVGGTSGAAASVGLCNTECAAA